MNNNPIFYQRNLPHYQPVGYTFFVTYRLDGSLPIETIRRLKAEREKELRRISGYDNKKFRYQKYKEYQKIYFGKFDEILDGSNYGPHWLKNKEVADAVKELIHSFDKQYYDLICYCIMPNHVHQVFTPTDKYIKKINKKSNEAGAPFYIVTKILQDLKSKTAIKANKILNRSGTFWQHESYDHVVRDDKELKRICEYVLNNPVKAGLCKSWEDWKWSYCDFDLLV